MQQAISKAGCNPKTAHSHWASDVRYYTAIGCAAVTLGPSGGGMHSDDEWVDLDSLSKFYEILGNFILKANNQKSGLESGI
jgi:acetylornithine deacetylase/succinyl-diaminopimelate desuccinylase-like protein